MPPPHILDSFCSLYLLMIPTPWRCIHKKQNKGEVVGLAALDRRSWPGADTGRIHSAQAREVRDGGGCSREFKNGDFVREDGGGREGRGGTGRGFAGWPRCGANILCRHHYEPQSLFNCSVFMGSCASFVSLNRRKWMYCACTGSCRLTGYHPVRLRWASTAAGGPGSQEPSMPSPPPASTGIWEWGPEFHVAREIFERSFTPGQPKWILPVKRTRPQRFKISVQARSSERILWSDNP